MQPSMEDTQVNSPRSLAVVAVPPADGDGRLTAEAGLAQHVCEGVLAALVHPSHCPPNPSGLFLNHTWLLAVENPLQGSLQPKEAPQPHLTTSSTPQAMGSRPALPEGPLETQHTGTQKRRRAFSTERASLTSWLLLVLRAFGPRKPFPLRYLLSTPRCCCGPHQEWLARLLGNAHLPWRACKAR